MLKNEKVNSFKNNAITIGKSIIELVKECVSLYKVIVEPVKEKEVYIPDLNRHDCKWRHYKRSQTFINDVKRIKCKNNKALINFEYVFDTISTVDLGKYKELYEIYDIIMESSSLSKIHFIKSPELYMVCKLFDPPRYFKHKRLEFSFKIVMIGMMLLLLKEEAYKDPDKINIEELICEVKKHLKRTIPKVKKLEHC